MSNSKKNLNAEILSLFSGQASIVTIPKLYIQLTGSHSLALVLNQCIFWSNKSKCKDGYFFKTYEDWHEEIHIPERTLRRRFDYLEQNEWISTKVKKVYGKNTKHIKPNMDKIIESISSMVSMDYGLEPCSKIDPTGQSGRSEPANLSGSLYTDNNKQIKNTVISLEITECPPAKKPKELENQVNGHEVSSYIDIWNNFVDQVKEKEGKTQLMKVNTGKEESAMIAKIIKNLRNIAKIWPTINQEEEYKLSEKIKLVPKSLNDFLLSAYEEKFFMLNKAKYRYSLDIILRENNFKQAILQIKNN